MSDFAADISAFVKKANGNVDKVVRQVILELGKRIVDRSPVGDGKFWKHPPPKGYTGGRFRANWQHGFGQIPSGDLPDIDKTGRASMTRLTAGVKGSPVAGVHYIANNLPYAQALENGHSKRQAPTGMVGLTALEFQQATREAAAEINK